MRKPIKIDTAPARLKLEVRGRPYGAADAGLGLRLGYRRGKGAGSWIGEATDGNGGERQFRIGTADDLGPADGITVLTYHQAIAAAPAKARELGLNPGNAISGSPVANFDQALTDYAADLETRGGRAGNASQVRHHLAGHPLLDKPLTAITADDLKRWRRGLVAAGIKPATVVRVMKSARAALNLAAGDPRVAANREAWKVGLSGLVDHYEPVKRARTDAEVFAIIKAAYAHHDDFGLFVEVLARTGTRLSQAAALTVGDLQLKQSRVMMPSSRKGKGRKISKFPLPIDRTLAAKLAKVAAGRPESAPLLVHREVFFESRRKQDKRNRGWFHLIATKLGINETAYCLRHSSISRALLAGTPIALVAKNHDTSVEIIERVYGRFIQATDEAEALTRAGQLGAAPLRLVA